MTPVSVATTPRITRSTTAATVLAALVLAALAGFWVGRSHESGVRWETGVASAVEGQASIETGSWTYAVVGTVPTWIDRSGTLHTFTFPECIAPGEQEVRFAWVPSADPDLASNRTVVAVDCRHP